MGKKRIVKKSGGEVDAGKRARQLSRVTKRKLAVGNLYVLASYNNTKVQLTDKNGSSVAVSSSGALGFKGAKKGTPFAAAKVGELIGDQAKMMGVKKVDVVVKGVGSGRESAIRGFVSKGVEIASILDRTPIPFNGPRPPKPRRV
jgi:small subunit ribosomal protein S11